MASNIGFLLSILFLAQGMLFAGDLCSLQIAYSGLTSAATTASYYVSSKGYIDDQIRDLLYEQSKVYIVSDNDTVMVGEVYTFTVYKYHQPILLSDQEMTLSLKRSVIVGYI